jgi:putative SOS response-associated peptidase YedK
VCGRYRQARDPREVAEWIDRVVSPLPNIAASWNIAPTQDALVLRRHPDTFARHLDVLRWGLVPRWAPDLKGAARAINARAETVAEKPSFRDAFARRRCLVPAEGFYEWQVTGTKTKQPYSIAPADGGLLVFAGLWEAWREPASGEVVRTFTIVTTAANEALRPLHERMPVMLSRDAWPVWLGETPGDLAPILAGAATPPLTVWPVSPRVGRVAENDAALALPLT